MRGRRMVLVRVSTAKPWTSRKNRFGWNLACRGSFGWKDRISGRKGTRGVPGTPTHHFLTQNRFSSNFAYGGIFTWGSRISTLKIVLNSLDTPTPHFLTQNRLGSNLACGGILTRRSRISGLEPTETEMGTPTPDFWPKTDFAQIWYRGVIWPEELEYRV